MPLLPILLLAAVQSPTACAGAEPVPPALAAFARRSPVAASARSGERFPLIAIGRASEVRFTPSANVRFVRTPGKAAQAGEHGGMVAFDVARAGTYRVAFGGRGWIDVLEGGKPIESTAHGHGPKCSGIAKVVTFRLKPGRHVLQVSNLPQASAGVLIVPG